MLSDRDTRLPFCRAGSFDEWKEIMPIIEVKALAHRFDDAEQKKQVIHALTEALVNVYGESVRDQTWVLLTGVDRKTGASEARSRPERGPADPETSLVRRWR